MATTAEPVVAPGKGRRTRRLVLVSVAVVAVVLLGGGLTATLTLRHLDRQYGPVDAGNFWGPQSDRGLEFSKDGFEYHLAEKPGATARFVTSLVNRGVHSVKVTSVDGEDAATDIRWSVYRVINGGSVFGENTPWRTFPAIIPAGGFVRLLITIHHPANCAVYGKYRGVSTAMYSGAHLVHWQSLLHDHTTFIRLPSPDEGIRVC